MILLLICEEAILVAISLVDLYEFFVITSLLLILPYISNDEFLSDPFSVCDVGTVASYKAELQQLDQSPREHIQGIK